MLPEGWKAVDVVRDDGRVVVEYRVRHDTFVGRVAPRGAWWNWSIETAIGAQVVVFGLAPTMANAFTMADETMNTIRARRSATRRR